MQVGDIYNLYSDCVLLLINLLTIVVSYGLLYDMCCLNTRSFVSSVLQWNDRHPSDALVFSVRN